MPSADKTLQNDCFFAWVVITLKITAHKWNQRWKTLNILSKKIKCKLSMVTVCCPASGLNWSQLWPLRCCRCHGLTQFTRLSERLHRPLCPKSTHSSHRHMWPASGSASGSLVAVQPNWAATQLDFRRLPTLVTRGRHAVSPSRPKRVHRSTKVNRLHRSG